MHCLCTSESRRAQRDAALLYMRGVAPAALLTEGALSPNTVRLRRRRYRKMLLSTDS
jgi:hypothetical protein